MSLHGKEPSGSVTNAGEPSCSTICTMLQRLSEESKDKLRKKFDIAYFVAAICKLEARHGVDIGASYVNENAGKNFCKFIAKARMADL